MVRPFLVILMLAASAPPGSAVHAVAAADPPFEGTIGLDVVATDSDHQIFTVTETIPAQKSPTMTLRYPQWEIGSHAPTVSIAELAGLMIHIDGQRVEWRRDPIDMHAFTIDVPKAARTITVVFNYLPPPSNALIRPDLVELPWQHLLLYPQGWPVAALRVAAQASFPPGLRSFSSLESEGRDGDTIRFAPTSLAALVDAPVYAARNWRLFDLDPGATVPVRMDLIADDPRDMTVSPAQLTRLRAMVAETKRVFGPGPFRHYDAIVSLSDILSPGGGIEHLEEGENFLPAQYFTDAAHQIGNNDLIAHEFVHSWNGRFRQPADLASSDFNAPVRGSLLWVYEGQTEYWGRVLAARSGMRDRQDTLDRLALDAALVSTRSGRAWKTLADSANDAVYMAGHKAGWRDWQRREDYYPEGVLLWLDVDARLREVSGGRRGLDDFAHLFFATGGAHGVGATYRFADVCAALDTVARNDWAAFLTRHLDSHDDGDAIAGLARAGWRLVFDERASPAFRQDEAEAGGANLDYSIGLQVDDAGAVRSVQWNGPAFTAGLGPGARIRQVNGEAFTIAALEEAVRQSSARALTLTFESLGRTRTAVIDYSGPLRYPRLERIPGMVDRLTAIMSPHA